MLKLTFDYRTAGWWFYKRTTLNLISQLVTVPGWQQLHKVSITGIQIFHTGVCRYQTINGMLRMSFNYIFFLLCVSSLF